MKILLVSFSRTGTTEALSERCGALLASWGHEVSHARLEPRWQLPHPLWLLLSFVPRSRVSLRMPLPSPRGFDACLLALPKWTFSCPPVNEFLARQGTGLPPTAVLATCGGWDQDRYVASLLARLGRRGVRVLEGMAIRREAVVLGSAERALADFLGRCFGAPRNPVVGE